MFSISDSAEAGATIVHPSGKLDTISAKAFEAHLRRHIDAGNGALFVDMAGIDYVSSFGLRSILIAAKQMAPAGRKFALFSLTPEVQEVLRVSGFMKVMTVIADKQAALALVAGPDAGPAHAFPSPAPSAEARNGAA